jgi:hypothetical protein
MRPEEAQQAIAALRAVPVAERLAAAAALVDPLTEALARIEDHTAARLWIRLARAGTGRPVFTGPVPQLTRDAARAAAIEALHSEQDPLQAVRAAKARVDRADADAELARGQLREATRRARGTGVTVAALMAAAGVSRQTVYDWAREQ